MPPKPKFTREQIIGYALNIVERDGIKALTARELGKESERPGANDPEEKGGSFEKR